MELFPGLKLNVFWHTDETASLNSVDEDAEIPLSEYTIREHTFYTVDFVRISDYKNTCSIASGGFIFLVNETVENVNTKITEIKNNSFFNIN